MNINVLENQIDRELEALIGNEYAFTVDLTEENLEVEVLCEDGIFMANSDIVLVQNVLAGKGFNCHNVKCYEVAGELLTGLYFYY